MHSKRILLHMCCAPCEIYPLKKLRSMNWEVEGFFYNPNIYPHTEYALRKKYVMDYSNRVNCDIYFCEGYHDEEFNNAIKNNLDKPERCMNCWYLRLNKAAEHAKMIKVDTFSTTLLVSPYQDKQAIKLLGEKAAAEHGVNFFYYDFSVGYQEAVKISKIEQLYRQKYCGCKYSLAESSAVKVKGI
ncbi:MAG: epoxyqueuosine reductase QueH [Candidatus Omnitrophica bacterium]|nr:epoxyqueuosine reductase QueH [Candidatus Omnitrophota bacterium]